MYEVFWHAARVRYRAFICSSATVFQILCVVFTFVPPLLMSYRSEGFWLREDVYREQPTVSFKHRLLFVFYLDQRKEPPFLVGSTYKQFNDFFSKELALPLIKSKEIEHGTQKEALHLSINVPIPADRDVLGLRLLLFFDYRLRKMSNFRMESMADVNYESCRPGVKLTAMGNLRLKQLEPLAHRGRDFRFNTPLIDDAANLPKDFLFTTVAEKYSQRNITTVFSDSYYEWESPRAGDESFTVDVRIRYPTELVHYVPGFWQLFKWAWIQYLSILVIFLFTFERVKVFVFENQLLQTVRQSPLKESGTVTHHCG